MVATRPTAAINAPHRIKVRGPSPSRGINPHCAPRVATAPAIMTIEIGPSEPDGARCSRSITKKPRQVRVAACAWPAATPAKIHDRILGSFHLRRPVLRGAVAATTLAPVGGVASEG